MENLNNAKNKKLAFNKPDEDAVLLKSEFTTFMCVLIGEFSFYGIIELSSNKEKRVKHIHSIRKVLFSNRSPESSENWETR